MLAKDSAMNHTVVLSSINLLFGNSTKQKTKNSWGEEKAYKDYYAASDSWFDRQSIRNILMRKPKKLWKAKMSNWIHGIRWELWHYK